MNFKLTQQQMSLLAIVAILAVILVGVYLNKKKKKTTAPTFTLTSAPIVEKMDDVYGNKLPEPVIMLPEASLFPQREVELPEDEDLLLPVYDETDEFAKQNPVTNLLKEQNYLIGAYPIGIDTIVQTNKIPYLDIRSLPPIPKENIWPINQSSYEQPPGLTRRGFELGP